MAVAERSAQIPLYREVIHDRAFGTGAIAVVVIVFLTLTWAVARSCLGHPQEQLPVYVAFVACLMAFVVLLSVLCYSGVYPLLIAVDEQGVILRSGKFFSPHNKIVPFSSITMLRRSRYRPRAYELSDLPVDSFAGAQVWKMGGKEVLEIEAQDSRRIIILSAHADQLASLLHEMTRVPVEDCR